MPVNEVGNAKILSPERALAHPAALLLLVSVFCSLFFNQQHSQWLGFSGLVLLGGLLVALVCRSFWPPRLYGPTMPLVWGFWLCWVVAGWFSPVDYVSETTIWSMVSLPLAATTVFWLGRFRNRFWFSFHNGLTLLVLALALFGCYQFFVEIQPPRATFINKNNFAALQMLVLLLALGRYLGLGAPGLMRLYGGFLLFSVLILSYVIGLIGSRGALMALLCGVVFILVAGWIWRLPPRRLAAAFGMVFIGLLLANLTNMGELGQRIASLQSPFEVGSGAKRVIIWSASVEMLERALPFGIGPGLYWLLYPQYRQPADTDGGFYVHNDYLQFVIEAGPAALVLFLLLAATATFRAFRVARDQSLALSTRMEVMTLLAALSALVGHSLLTFNLYLVPILIVAGAILGRLALLTGTPGPEGKQRPGLARSTGAVLVVLLVVSSAVFYAKAIGAGLALDAAMKAGGQDRWNEAATHYRRAIDLWEDVDVYHYSYAWALFELVRDEGVEPEGRELDRVFSRLDQAQSLNLYRPQPYFLRGRIYEVVGLPEAGRQRTLDAIVEQYEAALELDPRYLDARFRLARVLLSHNRIEQGVEMLEAGLKWPYPPTELSQKYYRLAAEMRRILGDQPGYLELLERSRAVEERLASQRARASVTSGLF